MNNNSLAVYNGGGFEMMQRAASAMVKSGYFKDSRDEAQAIVKVMAGAELGIAPFAAMSGIHIVQGKPTLSSNLIATLVKNDPRYNYIVAVCDDDACQLEWFENGKPVGDSVFTIKEADGAGLTGKSVWKQYPSDMLFARALTRGARRFAPGIFGGAPVYTPEEVGADETFDGEIVMIKQPPIEPEPEPIAPPPDDETVIMETNAAEFFNAVTALVDRYDNVHAAKNAAKKLGYGAIPKDVSGRLGMYRAIKAHAAERDAEESIEVEQALLFDDEPTGNNYDG